MVDVVRTILSAVVPLIELCFALFVHLVVFKVALLRYGTYVYARREVKTELVSTGSTLRRVLRGVESIGKESFSNFGFDAQC